MREMIQRSSVDQALRNLSEGMQRDLFRLKATINSAWGQLEDARKTARKNRDALVDTAERNRKKKFSAAEADYNREARGPEGASYESYQQERTRIDDGCTAEKDHAADLFGKECEDAENKFRTRTAEYIEQFAKGINTSVENFKSAHP